MNSNPWILAFRLKTLPAAIAPVFIGTAMAIGQGVQNYSIALVTLLAAVCIQIGTNLANDYFDFKNGADTPERLGPVRVTQAGLIAPKDVRNVMILVFGLSVAASSILIWQAGWVIAVIGVLSILSGIFYTAGPRPLGYVGLGELFVLVFFGPVAVAGTYFVQSLELNGAVILAGLGPGLLSVAILAVNNLRDRQTDLRVKKNTLAVRYGRNFAVNEIICSVILAALIPVAVYVMTGEQPWSLLSTAILFMAIPIFKTVITRDDGPSLNAALSSTGKLLFVYSCLYAIGWVVH
jgi:1,4-dihydroxy-2-naphthoate octaprenyltransferase